MRSSQWSADPTKRSVGTISIAAGPSGGIDLIANGDIKSGKLAALLQMRDQILPAAQAQIDQIAGAMSSALSDRTVGGTAVTSDGQTGFDVDVGALQAGNTVKINYTDGGGTQRTITDHAGRRPEGAAPAGDRDVGSERRVVGVDFSGGMASVLGQINVRGRFDRHASFQIPPARHCASSTMARAGRST